MIEETDHSVLSILENGNEVMSVIYRDGLKDWIENDPTPMIEKEDFDFGLFVKNALSDKDRQRRLLRTW